ncbi:MAG: platelet-activating factor acetylhydrolase IB subunit [Pirellulaceae bacterium]
MICTRLMVTGFLTLLLLTPYVQAEDAVLALKPEVQTAEWAKPWWMPRHEQKLAEIKAAEKIDLVMIGDSITHGWENAGKAIWEKRYAPRHALNLGYSGDRTEQVLWRFENGELDGYQAKLAVIMIGTNNTGHRQDKPEETAAGIRSIIDQLKEKQPAAKILLLAVFPRGENSQDALRKINDDINSKIKDFADGEKIHYLDLSGTFLEEDGTLPKKIMPDLLHPNTHGYELWAEAMEGKIRELLGEG